MKDFKYFANVLFFIILEYCWSAYIYILYHEIKKRVTGLMDEIRGKYNLNMFKDIGEDFP